MNLPRRLFVQGAAAAAVAATQVPEAEVAPEGLVNVAAVRASLPRMFTGKWPEIFAELLQNSQRAGARVVNVNVARYDDTDKTGRCTLTIEDDGCGLDGTLAGFHKLLSIGDSGWSLEVMQAQSPLGMGLHSLLAHERVRQVTMFGGGRRIEIDRQKWWHDESYYTAWPKLMTDDSTTQVGRGFKLEVQLADTELTSVHSSCPQLLRELATGYSDLLEVRLNGAVAVLPPPSLDDSDRVLRTTYQNEQVEIIISDGSYYSLTRVEINWYGQLITVGLNGDAAYASFYHSHTSPHGAVRIRVHNGCPFTMRAPTRQGVVHDTHWNRFLDWLRDEYEKLINTRKPPLYRTLCSVLAAFPPLVTRTPWCALHELSFSDYAPYESHSTHRVVSYAATAGMWILAAGANNESVVVYRHDGTLCDDDDVGSLGTVVPAMPAGTPKIYENPLNCQAVRLSFGQLIVRCGELKVSPTPPGDLLFFGPGHAYWVPDSTNDDDFVNFDKLKSPAIPLSNCALHWETAAYNIDDCRGVLLIDDTPDWQNLLSSFYREDEDSDGASYDEQRAEFSRSIELWLHEVAGGGDFAFNGQPLSDFIRTCGLRSPGSTLQPVYENGRLTGFDVVNAGGETRFVKLLHE